MKKIYSIILLLSFVFVACGKKQEEKMNKMPEVTKIQLSKAQKIQHSVVYFNNSVPVEVSDKHEYVSTSIIKMNLLVDNKTEKNIKKTEISIVGVEFNQYDLGLSIKALEEYKKRILSASKILENGITKNATLTKNIAFPLWMDWTVNDEKIKAIKTHFDNFDYSLYEERKSNNLNKSTVSDMKLSKWFDCLLVSYIKNVIVKTVVTYEDGTTKGEETLVSFDDSVLKITEANQLENGKYIELNKNVFSQWVNGRTSTPLLEAGDYVIEGQFSGESAYIMFTDSDILNDRRNDAERIVIKGDSLNVSPKINKAIKNISNRKQRIDIREYLEGKYKKPTTEKNIVKKKIKNKSVNGIEVAVHTKKDDVKSFNVARIDNVNGTSEKQATFNAKVFAVGKNKEGNRQVNIWIEDGVSVVNPLTDVDAEELANKFMNESGDDIYSWITNVYGKEWIEANETLTNDKGIEYIDGKGEVDILVANLNQTYGDTARSYVMGYFWSVDTYKKIEFGKQPNLKGLEGFANQRNMFYVDALIFSIPEYKTEIYSTLAHEFVHMINWYQKDLLKGANTTSWLNEMLAMIGEDLVDNKLGVPGSKGRAPEYNAMNYNNINDRDGHYDLPDYATGAMYGAYLTRNYVKNDMSFIRNIMHNEFNGEKAIEYAIEKTGSNETFLDTLGNFGKATILSSDDANIRGTKFWMNRPEFTVEEGSIQYKFEPINLFDGALIGKEKFISFGLNDNNAPLLQGGANLFYDLGNGLSLSGNKKFSFNLPKGVNFEVIVKNSDGTYNKEKSEKIQNSVKSTIN